MYTRTRFTASCYRSSEQEHGCPVSSSPTLLVHTESSSTHKSLFALSHPMSRPCINLSMLGLSPHSRELQQTSVKFTYRGF